MISIQNVTYNISGKTLIDSASMEFQPGKLNIIIGPNGAGKSTLIKLIGRQIKASSGKILFAGKELENYSDMELARVRAVLSQNIDIVFPMKVWEVVMMGRYPHFSGKFTTRDEEICTEAMDFVEILDFADRNYQTLSGGERQRVHFARIMSQIWGDGSDQCRYLFLDEPLTYLDVHYQFDFLYKIQELMKTGKLVVVGVLHDLNLSAKFGDYLVLLNNGRLLAKGSKFDVLTKGNITNAFRLEPDIIADHEKNALKIFFE